MTPDTAALRALADAATPGRRLVVNASDVTIRGTSWRAVVSWGRLADADLIGALDPDTVRALCDAADEVERLRVEADRQATEIADLERHIDVMAETWRGAVEVTRERDALRVEVARLTHGVNHPYGGIDGCDRCAPEEGS